MCESKVAPAKFEPMSLADLPAEMLIQAYRISVTDTEKVVDSELEDAATDLCTHC